MEFGHMMDLINKLAIKYREKNRQSKIKECNDKKNEKTNNNFGT